MSATIKLVGSEDANWDSTLENADHSVDTRLIGKEDIYWDSEGKDEKGSFIDRMGTDRPITLLNASHIPLPIRARESCNGAENIADGMVKLSQMVGTGSANVVMTKNKSITLASNLTHAQKQSLVNSQIKNLGGHTLTVNFPEAIDISFSDCMTFFGFYNGTLAVDLNGITISDTVNITKLFHFYDCNCKVEVKDGTMQHTVSLYAILAERCPHIYLTNVIFIGSGGTTNYAFSGIDSDGYASGCTYSNDNAAFLTGFSANDSLGKASEKAASAVSMHNGSGSAHAVLFANKAAANHTHTPQAVGAEPAGTAASNVGTHNTASNAHNGILAPLASPTFTGTPNAPTPPEGDNSTKIATTGFVARAVEQSGIVDQSVSSHNRSATAHNGILAPLASPVFTGTPQVPTAVNGTNSDQAASTKFVQNSIDNSSKIPEVADKRVSSHNTASNAHQTLFNSKAAANHTHTPQAVGADPAGTAASNVGTHNTASNAHQTLFNSKAAANHTHTPQAVGAEPAGTANSSVASHDAFDRAHANLLAQFIPAGTVFPFAGNGTVPALFLLCDGRAVSRTTFSRLFSVIGILYGSGDGLTTFDIPDFRGSFLRGYLSGTSNAIGVKQAEGLPNITGGPLETEDNYVPTGAIYRSGNHSVCGDRDHSRNTKHFDASKSNSIYGASTHVTPVNFAVQFIIKY